MVYTFKRKALRPNAPKTQFESFCSRFLLPNDFDVTNNNKCYTTATSAQAETKSLNNLILYPNPSKGEVTAIVGALENTNGTLTISDVTGKILKKEAIGITSGFEKINVPTEGIKAGVYFVSVETTNSKITRRLIIE